MNRDDWNRRYAASELVWSAGPNGFLVDEVAGLPPGRALDLACGEGRNAVWLARTGWRVTAVDFSDVGLAKARRRAADARVELELVQADLVEWEPEPGAFDLVCLLYLQLVAAELRVVLDRAAAAVAPGGTFLLVAHDLLNLTEGHGGPSEASVLYTPDDVVAALDGLEVERAERVLREVAGADRPAIDCLVRARRAVPGSAPAPT